MTCGGQPGAPALPTGAFRRVVAGTGPLACGLRDGGTLACWGQVASVDTTPPAGTFIDVAVGDAHACAIRGDGTVACWGREVAPHAVLVPPPETFRELAAASDHTCGITTVGTLRCWGRNTNGEAVPPSVGGF